MSYIPGLDISYEYDEFDGTSAGKCLSTFICVVGQGIALMEEDLEYSLISNTLTYS